VLDSNNHRMIVWSPMRDPFTFSVSEPLWALDLSSMQWSRLPLLPSTPLPSMSSLSDDWAMVFDPIASRVVMFFPSLRQVFYYDPLAMVWIAPPEAQRTAPDYRMYVAGVYEPNTGSLLMHGGYFVSTVRENVYLLHLDTWLWDLPTSAQFNAPSRNRHSATFDTYNNR